MPIINIEPLFDDSSESWTPVDQAIGNAGETFGGFVVVGLPHSVRPETSMIRKLLTLFDLPQPLLNEMGKKEMCPESKRSLRGYVDRRTGGFAYNEIFDIGPERPASGPALENIELLTESNVWPSKEPTPNWREDMTARFIQMEALGIRIIRSLARFLNVDETAAAARYQNSSSSFRLLKYPGRPTDTKIKMEKSETRIRDGREHSLIGKEHTDNGGLTLQWQDQPGLQMKSPTGEWLDIPERSDGFSIHLGEALETQSSHRFIATPHRILGWDTIRHSIVFFLEPNLFSSIHAFSKEAADEKPSDDITYAASMLNTLRKTGRA